MTRILIIDDDEFIHKLLGALFQEHGYTVDTASDGRKGLALFRESAADLVITDINMPIKDGIEVILELKQNHPGAKIIAMSGGGWTPTTEMLYLAKEFGADYILKKPFAKQEILSAVEMVLGPHRQ